MQADWTYGYITKHVKYTIQVVAKKKKKTIQQNDNTIKEVFRAHIALFLNKIKQKKIDIIQLCTYTYY